jgi:hypothetical protein
LQQQAQLRNTWVVIMPATPLQQSQMMSYLQNFNSLQPNAGITLVNTCAARTAGTMMSAGILNQQVVTNPAAFGFPFSQLRAVQSIPGAQTIFIPKNGVVPALLQLFDPVPQP